MALTDQIMGVLPKWNMQQVGQWAYFGILFILILIVVSGIIGWWLYSYIMKKRFNKIIRLWEKVDGRYKPTKQDTAWEKPIGKGGDTIFYFRKTKKIVPRGTIQTGNNTYFYAVREDGELINIGMEDIDLKMHEIKVNYSDKETRYARASLQKLNKDRYNKEGFWAKYGRDILTVVFIIIISVMLLLILSKMVDLMGSVDNALKQAQQFQSTANSECLTVLGKIDTLKGAAFIPVNNTQ